ncbi:MAG: biotin synthase BioB [Sedimentisphaerales bacterium]|nr:biotin synthase BioB [Sedimentisphaerales bacterium]
MNKYIESIAEEVLAGGQLERPQIDELFIESKNDPDDLLYWANKIRQKFFGNRIKVCSIIPGRVGGCDQDCAFCAQSARYATHVGKAKILSDEEILAAAAAAKENGVPHLGIVYSGKVVSDAELSRVEGLVKRIKETYGISVCAGLGILSAEKMKRLAAAGVARYNHNLETSRSHYGKIVSTHCYDDRISTVEAAKAAGLGLCTGGIFGIGENDSDRIDMALELRRLAVDMVPMNFLHPIPGTPLGDMPSLEPKEILRLVGLYRFILPQTHLKVAGGRLVNLRDLQSWVFYAGATSIMSGNFLTTAGRAVKEDVQMLKDLGLEPWETE